MTLPRDIDLFLRRIAVAPHASALPPVEALSDADFSRALQIARATSLEGQLLVALEEGAIHAADGQQGLFADRHRRAMIHSLRTERGLLAACQLLKDVGIQHCVLKGVALAHTAYTDPATRSYNDADLLVEPGRLSEAARVLTHDGWRRVLPEVAPGFDDRFAKDLPVLKDGVAIDLHRTLVSGPYGTRIDVEGVLDRATAVPIGAGELLVPTNTDLYIHAAITAGAGDVPPRLVTLSDMLALEATCDFDPKSIAMAAAQSHIEAPVARGVQILSKTLQLRKDPMLLSWAEELPVGRIDRFYLASYRQRGRSYTRALAGVLSQETWNKRTHMARALILPSKEYRRARSWTIKHHFERASKFLRR